MAAYKCYLVCEITFGKGNHHTVHSKQAVDVIAIVDLVVIRLAFTAKVKTIISLQKENEY